jgi:proline iminopeptidase
MQVVPDGGHSANEVGIAAELVAANERLKDMMKK